MCLYFAALRSTTHPPSVPLPRGRGNRRDTNHLSLTNCPPVFIPFLKLWSSCVPTIQQLAPEHQHDLARIICGLPPLAQLLLPVLNRLAADLRSISIEISQRRSFQDRYASDLQAAIDVGGGGGGGGGGGRGPSGTGSVKASFVPPPMYAPSPAPPYTGSGKTPPSPSSKPPPYPSYSPPHGAYSSRTPSSNSSSLAPPQQTPRRQRTPTIAAPTSLAIELIRETLYAALADVLSSTPSLLPLLKSDPPRAYFGAVALAILAVSTSPSPSASSSSASDDNNNNVVIGVRGVPLTLADCPAALRPLMSEFSAIGREAAHIEEEDTAEAIRLVQEGRDGEVAVPRLERARLLLERGAGYDVDDGGSGGGCGGRRSAEGRAVAFANRVNALALAMTRLPQFKERQDEVFKVLAGVGLSS